MNSSTRTTMPKNYDNIFKNTDFGQKKMRFFAAANSRNGFVSFFDKVFSPEKIGRLFILGGGPGSGKSTAMRKVAALSENGGYTTELIHCSSSPASLDGVIIKEKNTAVIDGTSPHTYSPICPGVREIAVDLGKAWDTKALSEKSETLGVLNASKKKAYRKAYIYFRAAGLLLDNEAQYAFSHTLSEKLFKNVSSVFEKEISSKKCSPIFSPDIKLQRAVSCKGNIFFDSFSALAEKTYLVSDFRGISALWFKTLFDLAAERKIAVDVSFTPEDPSVIDGIFFKERKVAFTLYAENFDKNINCARFADKEHFSPSKNRHAFVSKSIDSLLAEGYGALACAGEVHDRIEKEYFPCTDFSVTEEITENMCREIFG